MVNFILGSLFGLVMTTMAYVLWDYGVWALEIWLHYTRKGKR